MKTEQKYEIIDNIKGISKLQDNSIDLTVTSPPYDNLRTYNGYSSFDFEALAKELYRVTKDGGVVVWVVGDETKNGSESGTSFKQALFFKGIGFNLHDTMIYDKGFTPCYDPRNKRYKHRFEYMFVFSKKTPKTYNPICDVINKNQGITKRSTGRNPNGSIRLYRDVDIKETQCRGNIWTIDNGYMRSSSDKISYEHPATFPEQLAKDHILSWSNEGDWVLDPFLGSGTTLKMCMETNRNGIGFEINPEYEQIISNRLTMKHLENNNDTEENNLMDLLA